MSNLQLVRDLPNAELMAVGQTQDATDLLHAEKSQYPRFKRLAGVHALAGSMAPGEIWMVGAQVGSGKSLFCQNLMDDLVEQELPTLYIGTEQDVEVLRIKYACIRAGVSPRFMLKPEPYEESSPAYLLARDSVQVQLKWLRQDPQCNLALFATSEYVNRFELDKWINGGVAKYDIRCVIVDHIDQVAHGSGQSPVTEATATLQMLHGMARKHEMPIVIANQVRRHADAMKRYAPPEIDDFAGTSAKERIASVAFGLWRPLRTDYDSKELRKTLHAAKSGVTSEDRIYQSNTMGVRLLKDRLGSAPGKQTMLFVGRGGRLEDDPATTHGIRTGSRL